MLHVLCLAPLAALGAGAIAPTVASRPGDIIKVMNVEIREQQAANTKAAEEARAEKEERQAHASHLAKLVSSATASVKEAQAEDFAEAKARFEATRAHIRSRPLVRGQGRKLTRNAPRRSGTSLAQSSADPEAFKALLKEAAKKADSKPKVQAKPSPLSQLVSAVDAGEDVRRTVRAKKTVVNIKKEQRMFEERRQQLLARKDSPTRLAAARRAAAKAAKKKNATRLALHSANQTVMPKLHTAKAPVPRALAVRKSKRELEEDSMLDFRTRQCVDQGSGCFEKFEACAQDFCSVTKLPQEECMQKAVGAYHRLEKSGAKVNLSCN